MNEQFVNTVQRDRLLDTAVQLINIPSPTRSAAAVAERLEAILRSDGFDVQRPEAGWPDSPAVVARLESGSPGQTMQFNGHLDTVHLDFVPARVANGMLYGSGCIDMKGGVAAAVEAMRALRDTGLLNAGAVMLTAHDLHESPWGDGSQLLGLIEAGFVGDGVLLPEYLCDRLPVVGRGQALIDVEVTRAGEPVHEVLGGIDGPSVIAAGAEIVRRFRQLDQQLAALTHPLAGRESIFVGEIHAGEIFNQSPTTCRLAGTRRWLPGTDLEQVMDQYQAILSEVEDSFQVKVQGNFHTNGLAYEINQADPLVTALQTALRSATGKELPIGSKPFVDDGNAFVNRGGVPAVTHGPRGKGAHTVSEEVDIDELVRVAQVYAHTAVEFCRTQAAN